MPVGRVIGTGTVREYTPTLQWLTKKPLSARDYLRKVH
jgi:hypothetical protein